MVEKAIEKYLVKRVQQLGGKCYKWVSTSCRGVPDRIVILPHNNIHMVELKQYTGRLSPLQRQVQSELQNLGANVHTFYNKEQIDAFLEKQARENDPSCPF